MLRAYEAPLGAAANDTQSLFLDRAACLDRRRRSARASSAGGSGSSKFRESQSHAEYQSFLRSVRTFLGSDLLLDDLTAEAEAICRILDAEALDENAIQSRGSPAMARAWRAVRDRYGEAEGGADAFRNVAKRFHALRDRFRRGRPAAASRNGVIPSDGSAEYGASLGFCVGAPSASASSYGDVARTLKDLVAAPPAPRPSRPPAAAPSLPMGPAPADPAHARAAAVARVVTFCSGMAEHAALQASPELAVNVLTLIARARPPHPPHTSPASNGGREGRGGKGGEGRGDCATSASSVADSILALLGDEAVAMAVDVAEGLDALAADVWTALHHAFDTWQALQESEMSQEMSERDAFSRAAGVGGASRDVAKTCRVLVCAVAGVHVGSQAKFFLGTVPQICIFPVGL